MRPGAHVKSIEALAAFRAALSLFQNEAEQALASIQAEIQDFVEWLEIDMMKFWRAEIRNREQHVADAKADLHRCLSATIDPHRTPSCYQEKKVLDAAKKRLREAEDKLAVVRRWIPVVRQAVVEYRMKVQPLDSALSGDTPVAMGFLDASVRRLEEYLSIAPPSGSVLEAPPEPMSPPAESRSPGPSTSSVSPPAEESNENRAAPAAESIDASGNIEREEHP
ncbi:MAG TPA: hypothetical protein VHD36_16500 [Pirellulales bacterium]|nr:hypothetical protein [Pirellulales bacterium]